MKLHEIILRAIAILFLGSIVLLCAVMIIDVIISIAVGVIAFIILMKVIEPFDK